MGDIERCWIWTKRDPSGELTRGVMFHEPDASRAWMESVAEFVSVAQLQGAVEDNEGLLKMLRELHAVALTDGYGETVAERAAALIDRFESR